MSDAEQFEAIGRLHQERKQLVTQIGLLIDQVREIGENLGTLSMFLKTASVGPDDPIVRAVDGPRLRMLLEELQTKQARRQEIARLLD
jgi:hypothetical protein